MYSVTNAQETVFMLFKSDTKTADEQFDKGNYYEALRSYQKVLNKNSNANEVKLKLARCYYLLKKYNESVETLHTISEDVNQLPASDIFLYAEAQTSLGNYEKAIEAYRKYLIKSPGDDHALKKIWRLKNIKFLYEDSLMYAVRPVPFNSVYSEMCPFVNNNQLIFVSNRKGVQPVRKVDATSNSYFYKMFSTSLLADTILYSGTYQYSKPISFGREISSSFHDGPTSFYNNGKSIVFSSTSKNINTSGERTIQLFFAEYIIPPFFKNQSRRFIYSKQGSYGKELCSGQKWFRLPLHF